MLVGVALGVPRPEELELALLQVHHDHHVPATWVAGGWSERWGGARDGWSVKWVEWVECEVGGA